MLNLIYSILLGLVWVVCLPHKAEVVTRHIPITDKVAVGLTNPISMKERTPT